MILDDCLAEAGEFFSPNRRSGTDDTRRFAFIDGEYAALKKALAEGDRPRIQHPLFDVLFRLMELAAVSGASLDEEWTAGAIRKRKYEQSEDK